MQQIWDVIRGHEPKKGVVDGYAWELNSNKKYVVKKVYESLVKEGMVLDADFYQQIWKLTIPSKVKGFIWRLSHDRIQTMDNLNGRKIILEATSTLCVFRNELMESSKHPLFDSSFAHYIWTNCYLWYGDIRVLPNDCIKHFEKHKGSIKGKKANLVWGLWLHRNEIRFNAECKDAEAVMEAIKYRTWSWCKANIIGFESSLDLWNIQPLECLLQLR